MKLKLSISIVIALLLALSVNVVETRSQGIDPNCTVNGYNVTYDGSEHTATGSCTDIDGNELSGLDLSATTHTDAGEYPTDAWTFTDVNGNYNDDSGTVSDSITPASSTVTVTCTVGAPYTYTGLEQTPCTAEATGAGMSAVDVTASLAYGNNINPGTATADASWGGDSNHTGSSGSGGFTITPASSTVTVICAPSVTWTGSAKTPCMAGATGAGMSAVDVSASLVYGNNINPGTATADASWGGDANHTGSTGSGGFTINKAVANCTVTGYSVTYDGSSHTTTTGTCTGVNDETLSGLDLSATTHTEARSTPYNDTWTFTDVTGNYKDASGPVQDSIAKAEADCSSIIDTYIGTYNGNTYPNGTCTGAGGVDLHASLDLGTTFTNAGSGFTHWKFSGGNNYNNQENDGSVIIIPADATCTVTPYSLIYDGNPHTATGTCHGVKGETLSTLDLSATTHTDAGDYPGDAWTFTASTGNYNNTSGIVNDNITPTSSTVTVTCPASVPWTGSSQTPCTASVTGAGVVSQTVTWSYTNNTNIGVAAAIATFAGDANHTGSSGSGGFSITQASSTVTVTCPASITYTGTSIRPCTANVTGAGGLNQPVTIPNSGYSNNRDVGQASVSVTWAGDTNHTGNTGTGTFQITPATATCTITNPSTYTYDGNPHGVNGSCRFGGNNVSGLTSPTFTEAGTWPTTWTFNNSSGNYTVQSGPVNIVINKVTANCSSITNWTGTYDGDAHGAGVEYGGNGYCRIGTNGPILHDLVSNSTFTNWPGGTATWTFTNPNVTGSPLNGSVTITINRKTATVRAVANSKTYGAVDPALATTNNGFVAADRPLITFSATRTAGENVSGSPYLITPLATGAILANYNVTYTNANFTINRKAASVSAVANSKNYGDVDPALTTTNSGFLEGDLVSITFSATRAAGENAGTYVITPSASGAVLANYTVTLTNANFTINSLIATCEVTPYSVTYDGNPHTATPLCTFNGLPLSGLLSGTTHTNAGSYNDNWTFTDVTGNYTASGGPIADSIAQTSSTLTVTCPASVPWTGSPIRPCSATVTGAGVVSQTVTWTYSNNTDVGTATANADFAGDTNHTGSSGWATFEITKSVVCTVTGYSVTYDGVAHTASGSCISSAGGDVSSGLNLGGTTHTNAGSYTDTWTFHDDTGTYDDMNGTVSDSIGKANATCNITESYIDYYDGNTYPNGTCTGIGGVTLDGLNLGTTYTNANTGGFTHWTFTNANYNPDSGWGFVFIFRATATCTFNPYTVTYDGLPHYAIGTCTGVLGENLSASVTLGSPVTNVPGGTTRWSFSNPNYNSQTNRPVTVTILKAPTLVTVTCPASVPYTGLAQTPCSAVATGPLLNLVLPVTYGANTNAGTATASANYAGDSNHLAKDGSATFGISKATSTVTVTCPASAQPYTGSAHEPCTASYSTSDGLSGSLTPTYKDNINAGTATASADYAGDENHESSSGSATFEISKANATCQVEGYHVTYDGEAHTATGTCTGVQGEGLDGLDLSATTHTNAGSYTDTWTFHDDTGNYNDASDTVSDSIARAEATCTVTAYTVTFDGSYHTATGACLGVKGETLSGLDLSATSHNLPGDYPGDAWTFTDVTGNYNNTNGTVHDSIARAEATCTVTAYTVTYDGSSHTATGSCTGVWDEILSGLDLSATTHTEAGDYPGDAWTLNNTNYAASGTVHDSIAKADATCMIIGDTRIYDGAEHGASGACTGVGGVTLTGLNLGSKHDHVPGGTAHWTFTNANYNNQSGSVSITINKAPSLVTVTCPFSVPYTGSAQKPCSALVTGAGGLNQPLTVEYNGNTNIGTATANADFAGDTDHTGSSGFKEFTITSAGVPGIPGIGAEETPTATSVPPISPANLKEDIAVGSDMKAPVLTNETQVSPALPTLSTTEVFGSDQGTASAPVEPATVGESQTPKILSTLSGSLGCIGTGFLGLLIFFMFKRRKKEDQE